MAFGQPRRRVESDGPGEADRETVALGGDRRDGVATEFRLRRREVAVGGCAFLATDERHRNATAAGGEGALEVGAHRAFGRLRLRSTTDALDRSRDVSREGTVRLDVPIGEGLAERRGVHGLEPRDVEVGGRGGRRHLRDGRRQRGVVPRERLDGRIVEVVQLLGAESGRFDIVGDDNDALAVVAGRRDADGGRRADDVVPAGEPREVVRSREPHRFEALSREVPVQPLRPLAPGHTRSGDRRPP